MSVQTFHCRNATHGGLIVAWGYTRDKIRCPYCDARMQLHWPSAASMLRKGGVVQTAKGFHP